MRTLLVLMAAAMSACQPIAHKTVKPLDSGAVGVQIRQRLTVYTHNGSANFDVEIADTPSLRAKGLMFRDHLAINHGMVFIFDNEDEHAFWMKNTPLSLDIIFFDGNWSYVGATKNAKPYSTNRILVGKPSRYVLEIGAGLADQLGIGKGSRAELRTVR